LVADLDGDGQLEVVVGSDDGGVYIWRADGSLRQNWPQFTGGFVSASPTIADFNSDGQLEIIIGSWDRKVYAWRNDGQLLSGWPQRTMHFVWSTAAAADVDGDGRPEVIAASDKVYIWRADGSLLPGWPQATGSYSVASPLLADVDGDGHLEVIHGSDQLYAWNGHGSPLPGFPVDLDSYLWSSPSLGDVDGDGRDEIVVGGWDGKLYVLSAEGEVQSVFPTQGPIFATPTLGDLNGDGLAEIIVGSWDKKVYIFGSGDSEIAKRAKPKLGVLLNDSEYPMHPAGDFRRVKEFLPIFVQFPPQTTRQGIMYYRADFESEWHPVPLIVHQGKLTGLIQPFLAGTEVQYYALLEGTRGDAGRIPQAGTFSYKVGMDLGSRVRRRIRRLIN
jgi:hypothetical protein